MLKLYIDSDNFSINLKLLSRWCCHNILHHLHDLLEKNYLLVYIN